MKLNEDDSVSEADRDTLGPLPPPSGSSPWGNQLPYSGSYIPPNAGFMPLPFNYTNDNNSSCKNFIREGSVHSGSGNVLFKFATLQQLMKHIFFTKTFIIIILLLKNNSFYPN